MPKTISLQQLRIASPCPAEWDQMDGDARVRLCGQCGLNVYNISEMTEREATELIANREGRMCIRMYRRADGMVMTNDCIRPLEKVSRWAFQRSVAAVMLLFSLGAAAMAVFGVNTDTQKRTVEGTLERMEHRLIGRQEVMGEMVMGAIAMPSPTPPGSPVKTQSIAH